MRACLVDVYTTERVWTQWSERESLSPSPLALSNQSALAPQQGGEGGIIVLLNYYRDQSTSLHSHMSASSVSFSLLLVPLRLMEIGRAPLARGGGCGTLVVGWAVSSAASAWPSAASSW